jgi:tRNA nucleotidyltransferase (CCA-adding enzyme)
MPQFKKIKLSPLVLRIGKAAENMGLDAYLVGGAVRDALTGKKNFDLDIMVEGSPEPLVKAIAGLLKAKVTAHPEFGTYTIEGAGGTVVDFATARKETYSRAGALPKVVFSTVDNDLLRRDFTVNTLAIKLNGKPDVEIIDLCGGKRDLNKAILRVLHPKSFKDDPTRIFRLARFASRGYRIDKLTEKYAFAAVKYIASISGERRAREFFLMLEEKNPLAALSVLKRLGAAEVIFQGIDISERLIKLSAVKSLDGKLALFFEGSGKTAREKIYGSLKFSKKQQNAIEKHLKPEKILPALNGHELIKMGYKQGPLFKKILDSLSRSGIISRRKAKNFVFDNFPQKI